MKRIIILLCAILQALFCPAQTPNGGFESWVTVDSIENPAFWSTNNYYVGYTPVAKTADALAGLYSAKISSTARDLVGTATAYGCAHLKFVPAGTYAYLTALVRVDTVDTEGEVSIRVKQWSPAGEVYETIGLWEQTTPTNGVVALALPLDQTGLDTILIELWAKNHYDPFTNTIGYTELIVDEVQLTNSVSEVGAVGTSGFDWVVFPNPATSVLELRFSRLPVGICTVQLFDRRGCLLQTRHISGVSELSLDVSALPPDYYFLKLSNKGRVAGFVPVAVVR